MRGPAAAGSLRLNCSTCAHLCVLDAAGAVVVDRNLPCQFESLLEAMAPYRDGVVIGVECMFGWYWLADRCAEHSIPFVLGHALYMKLIHGGKAKNEPNQKPRPDARRCRTRQRKEGLVALPQGA